MGDLSDLGLQSQSIDKILRNKALAKKRKGKSDLNQEAVASEKTKSLNKELSTFLSEFRFFKTDLEKDSYQKSLADIGILTIANIAQEDSAKRLTINGVNKMRATRIYSQAKIH